MKRWFSFGLFIMLFLTMAVAPAAYAESELRSVQVEVDGSKLSAEAYMVDGRTMVPLRAIFERLNATVEWDDVNKAVIAKKNTTMVKLAIGKTEAEVGGKPMELDVPPMLINGSTFVPLRFVSEALGAQVTFDGDAMTAKVSTGRACTISGGQVHSGTINATGETWSLCGSPHFVKGDFLVAGKSSPVLSIEAGAVVHFEKNASIRVGEEAPGGLVVEGTAQQPVVLTADTAGAEPGFWRGVQFYSQAVKGRASINHARIEYAGEVTEGAVGVHADSQPVQLTINDTEVKNSLYAGVLLQGAAQLSPQSGGLHITGTKSSSEGGGAPLETGVFGTDKLPDGDYKSNDADEIRIVSSSSTDTVTRSTTWRNVGVPYHSDITVVVEGTGNPILTLEPGVTANWAKGYGLRVGEAGRGGLNAVGTAEKPITFSSELGRPGAWQGIYFGNQAGSVKLQRSIVEYAEQGVTFWTDLGPVIKESIIRSNKEYGITVSNDAATDFRTGLGNTFQNNGDDQR